MCGAAVKLPVGAVEIAKCSSEIDLSYPHIVGLAGLVVRGADAKLLVGDFKLFR